MTGLFMRLRLPQQERISNVPEGERAAAVNVTLVPRSLASATRPSLAGYLLGISTFGWPLVVAGGFRVLDWD